MATVEEVKDFFSGDAGNQDFELLPTKESAGAPPKAQYLMQVVDISAEPSKAGNPMLSLTWAVVEPMNFARGFSWVRDWLPFTNAASEITLGKLDGILGEEVRRGMTARGANLDHKIHILSEMLLNITAVCKVAIKPGTDDYPDEGRRISRYTPALSWGGSGFKADDDLPL